MKLKRYLPKDYFSEDVNRLIMEYLLNQQQQQWQDLRQRIQD